MGPSVARSTLVASALLLLSVLAGCTEPQHQPEALVQATAQIGPQLYTWNDPSFGQGGDDLAQRRIRADLHVPADVMSVGFTFQGSLLSEQAYASFEVRDGNRTLLTWEAAPGRQDHGGTIGSFWTFREAVDLPAGTYEMIAVGRGDVGLLEFHAHGVPRDSEPFGRSFEVSETERPISVSLFLDGWGEPPVATVLGPGGLEVPVVFDDAVSDQNFDVPARAGSYNVSVDTTGWAGDIVLRVHQ